MPFLKTPIPTQPWEPTSGTLAGKGEAQAAVKEPQPTTGLQMVREGMGSHADPGWKVLDAKKTHRLHLPEKTGQDPGPLQCRLSQ